MIEREVFTDPSEAVLVILGEHKELQPHRELHDELLRQRTQASIDDPRPSLTSDCASRPGSTGASPITLIVT